MHLFWVHNLSRLIVHFLSACYVLLGHLTFHHVSIKFCLIYQVLSRFLTVKCGPWVVFEPVCDHGIEKWSQSCYKYCILNLLSEDMNINDKDNFVF